jgi:MFS family permease
MSKMMNQHSWGANWRSKPSFIRLTVTFCLFTDLFLYGLVVPILPFLIQDRFKIPVDHIQSYVSELLAAYSGASVLFCLPAGWAADRMGSRKIPLLIGLLFLTIGTLLFMFCESFVVMVTARCLQGMAAAVVWTVGLALIQDSVAPESRGQAFGTVSSLFLIYETCPLNLLSLILYVD